ncbi:protein 33K [bat adenovirus 3]|uniref:Protein 33K n=1 Tax=bat adenovirus 3 TaxID=2758098 RepID=D3X7C6_9ADEN|nr:protein 33K [bat adenovirus 3]ADD17115.1 protein 33K [bat adenovirus 3]
MEDETGSLSVEDISEEELESLPDLSPPASEETRPAKRAPRWDQKSKAPGKGSTSPTTLFTTITLATAASRRRPTPPRRSRTAALTTAEDSQETRQLRNRIFPTLYAIFQQSRGSPTAFKIKNRSLRSLLKSCLYHKSETQLLRTEDDAEALLNKYCQAQDHLGE